MKRLVFTGKSYGFYGDDEPDQIAVIGDMPKRPQKVRLVKRENLSIVPKMRTKHNGYRPGTILDLCTDQCRFSLESGLFCGVKVVKGSYCSSHDHIVHGRFREAAE